MSSTKITKYDLDDSVFNGIATESYVQSYTSGHATETYVNSYAQAQHSTLTVTLTVAGWSNNSQSVTATGVTATNTVIVSPTPDSIDAYGSAKIKCTTQTTNSLTFICEEVPEDALTVSVVILGV